jgi:pyruvate kinase
MKTKIIATLGPATDTPEKIRELIETGVGAFRLNTSHGEKEWHADKVKAIRTVSAELNLHIPIILDLQGPKIRVGKLPQPMELKDGDMVTLNCAMTQEEKNCIPVDYPGIINDLKLSDVVMLDDGRIQLKITAVLPDKLEAIVTNGGVLTSRKGINVPGAKLSVPSLSPKDIDYIKFAVENAIDWLALSFVRTKDDLLQAKEYVKQAGGNIPFIAKIEKPIALDNIDEIMDNSEGVMIARGDLGIEISPEHVPIVQKHLIAKANDKRRLVITATQMLESMVNEPIPTRAEASDVANAILDGSDAVMLSEETSVGKFPIEAVKMMREIAEDVESSDIYKPNSDKIYPL